MEVVQNVGTHRGHSCDADDGQLLPLVALVVAFAGLVAYAILRLAVLAGDHAAATTAADAAALAAASSPDDASRRAAELAARNGGRVLDIDRFGDDVRVTVAVGAAEATARARRIGGLGGGPGAPALRAALARAEQLLGRPIPARVGEQGLAVDVPETLAEHLAAIAGGAGLCRPDPEHEPTRFRVCGDGFTGRGGG